MPRSQGPAPCTIAGESVACVARPVPLRDRAFNPPHPRIHTRRASGIRTIHCQRGHDLNRPSTLLAVRTTWGCASLRTQPAGLSVSGCARHSAVHERSRDAPGAYHAHRPTPARGRTHAVAREGQHARRLRGGKHPGFSGGQPSGISASGVPTIDLPCGVCAIDVDATDGMINRSVRKALRAAPRERVCAVRKILRT